MRKHISYILLVFFISISSISIRAQLPEIGAEVFIEQGQTPQQIDTWFRQLRDNGLKITRIRLFERYMRTTDGSWDFSLFDQAFEAGDKYGIKIYGNLFPDTPFSDVGGFKFPRDKAHLLAIQEYLRNVVPHFSKFKSCIGWVPINEPGSGSLPKEEFTQQKFSEWKKMNLSTDSSNKKYEHFDFAEDRFLLEYNTWYLNWLCEEIRKYDPDAILHVNGHGIFNTVKEYNFPEWRKFLTSFGGSAHASWHFWNFERDRYTIAMSATAEIIRSGAGDLPWFMTELQGGNNTFSGSVPMCPTAEEITQWLWINLFTESKGAMFWCLNPRASGYEAGEWAMLDYKNNPSDRLNATTEVVKTLNNYSQLFTNLKEVESGINIVYIRESMWVENKLGPANSVNIGRSSGAGINSSLACFQALSEMGIQCNIKEISEFNFSKDDYTGTTIVLSEQVAIPEADNEKLKNFVARGGTLIVDGLTAYYDENAYCKWIGNHPLQQILGGSILEYKVKDNLFPVNFFYNNLKILAHLWQGTIKTTTGEPLVNDNKNIYAVKNKYGKGQTIWVPSPIGLGAYESKDFEGLANFLIFYSKASVDQVAFHFEKYQKGLVMKTAQSGNSFLTMIINKTDNQQSVQIAGATKLIPRIIFSNKDGSVKNNRVEISPEETLVISWNQN